LHRDKPYGSLGLLGGALLARAAWLTGAVVALLGVQIVSVLPLLKRESLNSSDVRYRVSRLRCCKPRRD